MIRWLTCISLSAALHGSVWAMASHLHQVPRQPHLQPVSVVLTAPSSPIADKPRRGTLGAKAKVAAQLQQRNDATTTGTPETPEAEHEIASGVDDTLVALTTSQVGVGTSSGGNAGLGSGELGGVGAEGDGHRGGIASVGDGTHDPKACWTPIGIELQARVKRQHVGLKRRGLAGRVVVRFGLDAQGRATDIVVEEQEGSPLVVEAAQALLQEPFASHCDGQGRFPVLYQVRRG